MIVRVVRKSIAEVCADAICTSTNPRLSLYEGTGGAVRERGGWEIKRACEALLERELEMTGSSDMRVGSVRSTPAGSLAAKIVIHCVASDASHRSSREIIAACVGNAFAMAHAEGCGSIAMPVFATGHAAFRFEHAVEAMAEAIRDSTIEMREITIAVLDAGRLETVRQSFEKVGIDARLESAGIT